ncbi:MAG: DNA/RNA non-specific endonuclease [Bacteroidales bacterium]|nr:DNA/RNA non-specific endonuclease [Bacteroidales bacterium]
MKKILNILFLGAVLTALAFSCVKRDPVLDDDGQDETETPAPGTGDESDDGRQPEPEQTYYVKVAGTCSDWSGEYLITYATSDLIYVLAEWDPYGQPATLSGDYRDFSTEVTPDGIPSEVGDPYKAVIAKVGTSYSIYIEEIGYLGWSSGNSLAYTDSAPDSDTYLWNISYSSDSPHIVSAADSGRELKWNSSHPRFACYESGQQPLTLYRRSSASGGIETPPAPGPEDPEPEPDEPEPTPVPVPGQSGKYSWYELPVMNLKQSGSYLVDASDSDLYYAYHHCAGGEKGPGGKTARNYTVCYSAEHHCPVWVAAPRHDMYEGSANRTNAYDQDPSIPSNIQYSSKNTGGSCNKGHMLGSAERTSSSATNRQVFYYTNIAPQYSGTFNTGGGGWNTLEDWVDKKVCRDTLYVVIGAYFETFTDRRGYKDSPKTISFGGRDDVTRPSMYYYILMRTKKGNTGKALKDCSADEIMCAAFVRSHATPMKTVVSEKDLMSVSELEKITGFTYFPNVPNAPKNSYKASDWGL